MKTEKLNEEIAAISDEQLIEKSKAIIKSMCLDGRIKMSVPVNIEDEDIVLSSLIKRFANQCQQDNEERIGTFCEKCRQVVCVCKFAIKPMEIETMSISDLLALRNLLEEKREYYYKRHDGTGKFIQISGKIERVNSVLNEIIANLE